MICGEIKAIPRCTVVADRIVNIVECRCGRILAGKRFRIQKCGLEGIAGKIPLGIRDANIMGIGAVHQEGEANAVEILAPLSFRGINKAVSLDLQWHLCHIACLAGIGGAFQLQRTVAIIELVTQNRNLDSGEIVMQIVLRKIEVDGIIAGVARAAATNKFIFVVGNKGGGIRGNPLDNILGRSAMLIAITNGGIHAISGNGVGNGIGEVADHLIA